MDNATKSLDINKDKFFKVNPSLESTPTNITNTVGENSGPSNDNLGVKYLPKLFQFLKDNIGFSFPVISLIGYIIIAAFGHISDFQSFFQYTLFIFICILINKVSDNRINVKSNRSTIFLLLMLIITAGIIVYQNLNFFVEAFNNFRNSIH